MNDTPRSDVSAMLTRLDWESEHFGFPVARPNDGNLDDVAMRQTLQLALDSGIELLVCSASPRRDISRQLLSEFGGALVDRKATFVRSSPLADDCGTENRPHLIVEPYGEKAASPALTSLAIAAGAYSRFRTDPYFPRDCFEAMYRIWIERSVGGELADIVLVACDKSAVDGQDLIGMITVSESEEIADIGLVAVSERMRGQGVGSLLIEAAHRWMASRQVREARVVTQLANVPACRLYERCGYRLADSRHIYHFWPRRGRRRPAAA